MTTEDDFQAALDAQPEDWQTRLVFADFLEERGDPRAEGYRALGLLNWSPWRLTDKFLWWDQNRSGLTAYSEPRYPISGFGEMTSDWFDALGERAPGRNYREYPSRREAEDAAALAFAKLPAERRAELLNLVGAGV